MDIYDLGLALDGQADGSAKTQQQRNKQARLGKKERSAMNNNEAGNAGSLKSTGKAKKSKKARKSKGDEGINQAPESTYSSPPAVRERAILPGDVPKSAKHKDETGRSLNKPVASTTVNGRSSGNAVILREPEQSSDEDDIQASAQLLNDALSAPTELEEHAAPIQPSKKALGKRKAPDTITHSAKKSKRRRKLEPPNRDLREMGFSPSASGSNRNSHDHSVQSDPPVPPDVLESLGKGLEKMVRDEWSREVREDSARRPVRPSGFSLETEGKYPKSASPAKLTERTESAPGDEGSEASTENREMDEDEGNEGSVGRSQDPAPESNKSDRREVRPTGNETERSALSSKISSQAPTAKRKRQLPVDIDEPESSTAMAKTPRKPSSSNRKTLLAKKPRSSSTPKPPATPGRLPQDDVDAISSAIINYRDMHDMSQFDINQLIQGSVKEAENLWQEVCDMVPNIPKQKIYNTARRKFHNFEARGSWTEEQDEELREAYERFPNKWTQIGQAINRFPEDCRDRWRNYLVCGNNKRTDVWDKEEEAKLKKVVNQFLEDLRRLRETIEDMRNKPLESFLDWGRISQQMDHTRSRLQCAKKWKALQEREESNTESENPLLGSTLDENKWRAKQADLLSRKMTPAQKLEILYTIRDTEAGREGKIPWTAVRQDLTFKEKTLTIKTVWRNLRRKVADSNSMRFKDILRKLIEDFENATPDEPSEYLEPEIIPDIVKRTPKKSSSRRRASKDEDGSDEALSDRNRSRRRSGKYLSEEFAIDDSDDEELDNGKELGTSSRSISASSQPAVEETVPSTTMEPKANKKGKKFQPASEEAEEEQAPEQSGIQIIIPSAKEAWSDSRAVSDETQAKLAPKKKKRDFITAKQVLLEGKGSVEEIGNNEPFVPLKRYEAKSRSAEASKGPMNFESHEDSRFKKKPKSKSSHKSTAAGQGGGSDGLDTRQAAASVKPRKSKSQKADFNEDQDTVGKKPTSGKKRQKLKDRMKLLEETQSQETTADHAPSNQDTDYEMAAALSSLKNGKEKPRKGKGKKSNSSEPSSGYRTVNSDDEQPTTANSDTFDSNAYDSGADYSQIEDITVNEESVDPYVSPDDAGVLDLHEDQDMEDVDVSPDGHQEDSAPMFRHDQAVSLSPRTANVEFDHALNGGDIQNYDEKLGSPSFDSDEGDAEHELVNGYANGGTGSLSNHSIDGDEIPTYDHFTVVGSKERQGFEDTTSTNGSDPFNDDEDEHIALPNGFHSPSPDLDTPLRDDGRQRRADTPPKFSSHDVIVYDNHRRSPSISSGSVSSIPARVPAWRELSFEL